jgi:molybdate transport system permease protein
MTSLKSLGLTSPLSSGDPFNGLWRYLSMPLLAFITLPIIALLLQVEPRQMIAGLHNEDVRQAIQLTLVTTPISTLLAVLLGTPVALMLSRKRRTFHYVIDTIVDLPTILPPSVAGLALLLAFGRRGLLGSPLFTIFGVRVAFTAVAVIIAQAFVSSPFYIKSAAIGFATVNRQLKEAACLDGAGPWDLFRCVTVPIAWPAIVGGGVMCWCRALGEFGATIIFAGNYPGRTQTMPLAIYLGFELNLNTALTLSAILIGFSFAALIVVKILLSLHAARP